MESYKKQYELWKKEGAIRWGVQGGFNRTIRCNR